jgi:hypothetical protein
VQGLVHLVAKLACLLFSFSFTCTCIAALGIYCPTTNHLLRNCTDSSRQIKTLASPQGIEGNLEEQALTPRNDLTITGGWRLNVNIRLGVAFNFVEGANTARTVMHTMVVVLVALAAGCTGFLTVRSFCLSSSMVVNLTHKFK